MLKNIRSLSVVLKREEVFTKRLNIMKNRLFSFVSTMTARVASQAQCSSARTTGHRFLKLSLFILALSLWALPDIAVGASSIRMYLRNAQGDELADARWRIATGGFGTWYQSGQRVEGLDDDWMCTLEFRAPAEYYTPTNWQFNLNGNLILTNTFYPWTNQFSVAVLDDQGGDVPNAKWRLSSYPASFTNYRTGSGSFGPVLCPTGTYVIVFSNTAGYSAPVPRTITNEVSGAAPAAFTSIYQRSTGAINITVYPTNGSWRITDYPDGFSTFTSDALSGTGFATITNAPSGTYQIEFGYLAGFETPQPQTHNITDFDYSIVGTYGDGLSVRVIVYQPDADLGCLIGETNYVTGIGTGSYTISGAAGYDAGDGRWMFASNSVINLTAYPSNMVITGTTYNCYFYDWSGYTNSTLNLIEIRVTRDMTVYLTFSREYYPFDEAGDLDQDGLPDEWERQWGLAANIASGVNGASGNPSGDYIPSSSINPPSEYSINTNYASAYLGTNATVPGYPLRGLALERGYNNTDPATATPFNNWLQCRGFDGYYKNRGPSGPVPDDDPRTDPKLLDTSGNGLPDGWSYYFWYWRSANSYNQGITHSANLSWVRISPSLQRMPGGTGSEQDTDGDGLTDYEEYILGTDPTHADTDGDGMDDFWETYLVSGMNPLLRTDGTLNDDDDYYAVSSTIRILTNGTPGTAFADLVYNNGSMNAVWVDVDTTSGAGVFDLYRDTILFAAPNAILTNGMAGVAIANPVLFAGAGAYQAGYPVWVDVDGSGTYSAGDTAIVNPFIKHSALYMAAPAVPGPGVTSFNPLLAWRSHGLQISTNVAGVVSTNEEAVAHNRPYTAYQEYLGGDYVGRVAWDAGGRVIIENDDEYDIPTIAKWTDPSTADTDGDGIPDGWELYVGMNPQDPSDASEDPDRDDLINYEEWANATDPLSNCAGSWPNKTMPTDPGVLVAPPPNDPHPADTDWDGVSDGAERAARTNPTSWDTDGDGLPDGWELYAGTDPLVADAMEDPDGDGLLNYQEYWTGTVPEWQMCDPDWGVNFLTRRKMSWDGASGPRVNGDYFMPPNFLTCPSFRYDNNINTNLADLRANFPAAGACGYAEYHTTLANDADSDGDGMDDYWEVYHGLNPLRGTHCLMLPVSFASYSWRSRYILPGVASADARPDLAGFQFGIQGQQFTNVAQFIDYIDSNSLLGVRNVVGPFNFGLELMDPDGDGLPNLEEYSYSAARSYYHTDPSPLWRTCEFTTNSFVNLNYGFDKWSSIGFSEVGWDSASIAYPFPFEMVDGFDTDGDMVGDYLEVNTSASSSSGNDPLDPRNPLRNRALYLNGINDFARTIYAWVRYSDSYFTRFCIEAWINPSSSGITNANAVIVERAGLYENPYDLNNKMIRANFRLGITNGIPYVMYNGRGAGTQYQATAQVAHKLQAGTWAHLAGVYDGTNLTIYVNGEASTSIKSTEIPATGYNVVSANSTYQAMMIGARDLTAGYGGVSLDINTADNFGGYIDELRIWNGSRTRSDIREYKDRRILTQELTNSAFNRLEMYYSFDDVPDPVKEGIVPEGLASLDTALKFHPTFSWWRDHPQRSTVYTGSESQPYNWIVTAQDHMAHKAIVPPMDDKLNMIWTENVDEEGVTNRVATLPEGYNNPSNPYFEQSVYRRNFILDLYLFNGAKGAAVASWLPSLDPNDPDSTDSDGDGLPDWWEALYGLDPYDPTGINGAWGDPDNDGLSNWAEYMAGTNPWSSDTNGDGVSDYDSSAGPGHLSWGELYSDGDGMPDDWEVEHGLDPHSYDAHLDSDGDGWSNYAEYQAGTDPSNPNSHPTPVVTGTISYSGTSGGNLCVLAYQNETMDGAPAARYSGSSSTNFTLTGLVEGNVYLFGFIDLNNNNAWDPGEPCGVAHDQPIVLSWANVGGVVLGISDTAPGYGRFNWTGSDNTNFVDVTIKRLSTKDSPLISMTVLERQIRAPRNYFHEWDYQLADIYGLTAGSYQWWANIQTGTFSVNWKTTQTTPSLVYPRGDTLIYSRNLIGWTMDSETTAYYLQVFDANLGVVINEQFVAPYPDKDGIYWAYLPLYASELGNGTYYWRVAGYNPECQSDWSDLQSFTINLSSSTSRSISGDIYYYGKVWATNIVVEAFDNSGFGGSPVARATYRPSDSAGYKKTSFTLLGLGSKGYYVRAFINTTPAGGAPSGIVELWSSSGFVPDADNTYKPRRLDLSGVSQIGNMTITIRDQDTDNDQMPDAWEMQYFGNLNQTGDMDFDGDGETNLDEYKIIGFNTDPTRWDTSRNLLSDRFARLYGGSEDYDPYCPVTNPGGKDLFATKWSTDGSGYSDGAQLRRYGTDPLNPNSVPEYLPECFGSRPAPADFDGDGRSDLAVYDELNGVWHLMTWYGQYHQLQFGDSQTSPMPGDYDGDGVADFALYEPAAGYWYVFTASGQFVILPFGNSTTTPVPGDYDGDWRTDFGIYDPATGYWYIYTWNGQFTVFQFGGPTMIPVPGDYNADTRTDFAVYDTVTGYWYIYTWSGEFYMLQFGNSSTIPVPGDYDGDDRNDFAVFEPATGYWYIFTWNLGFFFGQFGWAEAVPVPGDYSGDGRTDLAIYCTVTGNWYIYCWSGNKFYNVQFGAPGVSPVLKNR